ncbi:hypothetical protein LINGRAHAP2_LOCUS23978 [Linum grandiflorum]
MKFGVWKFGSFSIQADRWIPEVGRSNVMEKNRLCWIRIYGIPLHIRSLDLIRAIGNHCGRFIEADVQNWVANSIFVEN